jgi:hypothetical protein
MSTKTAIVSRGTVDACDEAGIVEQRRIERGSAYGTMPGLGARNCITRRYLIGEKVTLPADEVDRLVALGILRDPAPV